MPSPKLQVMLKDRCKAHAGWPTQKGPKNKRLSALRVSVRCIRLFPLTAGQLRGNDPWKGAQCSVINSSDHTRISNSRGHFKYIIAECAVTIKISLLEKWRLPMIFR